MWGQLVGVGKLPWKNNGGCFLLESATSFLWLLRECACSVYVCEMGWRRMALPNAAERPNIQWLCCTYVDSAPRCFHVRTGRGREPISSLLPCVRKSTGAPCVRHDIPKRSSIRLHAGQRKQSKDNVSVRGETTGQERNQLNWMSVGSSWLLPTEVPRYFRKAADFWLWTSYYFESTSNRT